MTHELISLPAEYAGQVRRTPDADALRDSGSRVWYARLREQAVCAAASPRAPGVRGGPVVGLPVSRSASAVAALLGVLEAGAAHRRLDPGEPVERANRPAVTGLTARAERTTTTEPTAPTEPTPSVESR
jgi:non-ribosomal peptide synthetase component F